MGLGEMRSAEGSSRGGASHSTGEMTPLGGSRRGRCVGGRNCRLQSGMAVSGAATGVGPGKCRRTGLAWVSAGRRPSERMRARAGPRARRGVEEPTDRNGRACDGRGIRDAATGWRNAGEVALDRDLTAGNAGQLDGDRPGLVGLGAGVCEEPALGEGWPHGRRRGRAHGGPQGQRERRCLRDGLDGHRGRVDPEDERGEAGEGVIAVGKRSPRRV